MFRFSNYSVTDIERMATTLSSSNIQTIYNKCIQCETEIANKLGVNGQTPLCTTIVTTESMYGFKEMRFVTKFTNNDIYNSVCYESNILNRNPTPNPDNAKKMDCGLMKRTSPFQQEVVNQLRITYVQLLELCATGMSEINDFNHLINYHYLFNYYIHKIHFMLNLWSDKIFETMDLDNSNVNRETQLRRMNSMSMKRSIPIFICGGFIAIPLIVIGSYLSICWLPCYTACKIASLDDEIEAKRVTQAKDKLHYWE
jgi:hypothetical protein